MKQTFQDKNDERYWRQFIKAYNINESCQQKFKQYFDLIIQENQKYNITAITSVKGVMLDHFYDSLGLIKLHDMSKVKAIADIGSGGGFPGIPLAIMFPDVTVHLIEVNNKKINFLCMIAEELGLSNVMVHTSDFRTFLRTVQEPIEMFTARASLQLDELFRMFKPSCFYNDSLLVYWASKNWVPTDTEKMYLKKCQTYKVGEKQRSLCFFNKQSFNTSIE